MSEDSMVHISISVSKPTSAQALNELRAAALGLSAMEEAKTSKPEPKKIAKPALADDEEDDAPAKPKKKVAKKPEPEEDDEDELRDVPKHMKGKAEVKAPAKKKADTDELEDDGEDQEPTIDGGRIMIRRVARSADAGPEYARAINAEFGGGPTTIPLKKMPKYIARCQEVLDDPSTLDLEGADEE